MPYIENHKKMYAKLEPVNAGELNYAITMMLQAYIEHLGTSYQTFNDVMGVLEGAKLEMYRRRIARYEDVKKMTNGDVY